MLYILVDLRAFSIEFLNAGSSAYQGPLCWICVISVIIFIFDSAFDHDTTKFSIFAANVCIYGSGTDEIVLNNLGKQIKI